MILEIYRIKELINKLNEYTKAYDKGQPLISDKEYDDLYFELENLEKETGIIYPDSPTQSIHFETVSELKKVKHNHPMLSLDKTKDPKEIASFVKGQDWCAMFKMDGLTCSLRYVDGKLVSAETRGNGEEGEDITHNIFVIKNVPQTIPIKEEIIIDGEIICDYISFEEFKNDYANPRNFAAGSIRQLSSKEAASRNLSFIAWDLIKGCDNIDSFFWRLEKLDDWGFETVPRVGDAETVNEAIAILDNMKNGKDSYIHCEYKTYPIDGYVFRFESQKYYNSLGNTDHHFRGAMAFKFYDEEYETKLLDIEWSMGRTGVLTPVAIFEPVDDGVSVIERASLHNVSIMRETLGEYPELYEKIWVYKANQIIPQIARAIKNNIPHDHVLSQGVIIHCPCCGTEVITKESDNGVLNAVCPNPYCEGKLANKIDHYCGKKGLDIKGLSMKTIEKLIDWGWVNSIKDIYNLKNHKKEWSNKPGFGVASVDKILSAIEESKNCEVSAFISSLGIPLVGSTVAKEITKYYETWDDFRAAVGGDWTAFDGFGYEMSKAINSFDYEEADEIAGMLAFKVHDGQSETEPAAAIKDKVFCITGKINHFKNRDELKAEIESLGGKVVGSMSSKVNYLITNTPDSGTAKNKAAQAAGIPIITEEEYLKMR